MIQLCYISSATPGRDVGLDAILSASRRNNAASGLTGLLVHDGRRFLQVIEGESSTVDTTYDRIRADQRHRAIVVLSRREVDQRQFGRWSMAAEQVNDAGEGDVAGIVDRMTEGVADANLRATFRSFARVKRDADLSSARTPR